MDACPLRAAALRLALPLLFLPAAAHSQLLEKYYPAANIRAVVIHADQGDLICRSGEGDEVHLAVSGAWNGAELTDEQQFTALRDSVWGDTLFLRIKLRSPTSPFSLRQEAIISLGLPRGMDLIATVEDGGINGMDLGAFMLLRTRHGTIHLEEAEGALELHTGSGTIYGTALAGSVSARCEDGNIDLAGRFDAVRAFSASGGISIRATEGSRAAPGKGGPWVVKSDSGNISLRLPKDWCARIAAHTDEAEDLDWGKWQRLAGGPDPAAEGAGCGWVQISTGLGRIRIR